MTFVRYTWGVIFSILAFGTLLGVLEIVPLIGQDWQVYRFFLLGILAYLVLLGVNQTFFEQNLKFFRTFTHELTHTLFTILSFKRIRFFQATSHKGGEVHVVGGGNMLILLSPYCIPIYTILVLLLQPLFKAQFQPYIQFFIGLTYLFHLHTNWLQTSSRQTDITKYPTLTAYAFIGWMHLLFIGIIMWSFQKGIIAFWDFPLIVVNKMQLAMKYLL